MTGTVLVVVPSVTVTVIRRPAFSQSNAVDVERAGVGGAEVEPQPELRAVVPAGRPALGGVGLWSARTSVVGEAQL